VIGGLRRRRSMPDGERDEGWPDAPTEGGCGGVTNTLDRIGWREPTGGRRESLPG
jgi:hypothetical protein